MLFKKYSNANDPRTIIFASNSNKKLGVTFNWAHPSSVKKRLRTSQLIGLALIALGVAGACIGGRRHLLPFYLAILPVVFISTSNLRRCAEEELVRHPGPIGPRTPDGLGAAEDLYTEGNLWRSFQLVVLLSSAVAISWMSVKGILGGMIWYKALISSLFFGGLILSLVFFVVSLLPIYRNWTRAAMYLCVSVPLLLCAKPIVEFCDAGWRNGGTHTCRRLFDPVEFCGVTFLSPSGVSTNKLSIRRAEGTRRSGDKEVPFRRLYWIGVDESLRPADFFDFAEIKYSFKTLTPENATFCAHFPKGTTRKECIALLEEFSAKLKEKYGLEPDAADFVQDEEEPVGFVPNDPPEGYRQDSERYWHKIRFYERVYHNDKRWGILSAGETDFGERCAILRIGSTVVVSHDEGVIKD